MQNDKMLNRIQALLNKADDPGTTEHEREACMLKAHTLMSEYQIDAAMLSARASVKSKPLDKIIRVDGSFGRGRQYLVGKIVSAMGLSCVLMSQMDPATDKPVKCVHVFGFESDLEIFQLLYTSLLFQASQEIQGVSGQDAGQTRSLRNGFWLGFADKVAERMRAAKAEVLTVKGTGTDLVLASRKQELDVRLAEVYPRLKRSTYRYSQRGYDHGAAAGSRADIHDKAATGATRRTALN